MAGENDSHREAVGGDRKCESEARKRDEIWESHGEVR